MHEGNDLGTGILNGLGHGSFIERGAPWRVDPGDLGAGAAGDVRHAPAEDTIDADDDGVARFQEVDQAGLHPGAPGSGKGEGKGVLGSEEFAQRVLDAVEDREEIRVEVPQERLSHGLADASVDIGRPRTQETTGGGGKRGQDWVLIGCGHGPRLARLAENIV